MGFFGNDSNASDAYNQVQQGGEHKSSWTHELIAGAAAFEAAKAYENHVSANGKPASHQLAKELFAGFAGAEADKLFESHGLNMLDREKAKYEAHKHAEEYTRSDY